MIREYFLRKLPPYRGNEIRVVTDQRVTDIIKEILAAHTDYATDYDKITDLYIRKSVPDLCRELFKLCKNEFDYVVEDENRQTVRSPAAIIALAKVIGSDCKHYASFIGGVLDALKRRGREITWCYRFCSYDLFDMTPEHVFIVVEDEGQEIWIDPVLETFDQRYPVYYHHRDKQPKMALYRVSGIGRQPIYKTTVDLVPGNNFPEVDTAYGCSIGAIAWAQVIQSAIPIITNFFSSLFGGGSQYTTGVQWLTQQYQYYVLGQANATSRTDAEDRYTPEAQAWFSTVLGVPIYDRYRLHALMGTNAADGVPLNNTDQQRAQAYIALGPDTQNVDPAAVAQAVQIAKKFKWGAAPGSWAAFQTPAPDVTTGNGTGNGSGNGNGGSDTDKPGFMDWIKANPFQTALIGAAVYLGVVRPLITRKRKRA